LQVNSKWIKNLNKRPKTIKLLEENRSQELGGSAFDNDFLAVTLKAQVTKIKIDKLDYVKTENFFEY
jgi:hypothetical protein